MDRKQYNVIVAPGPIAVAVSTTLITHGLPYGYRAYQVNAIHRTQAKSIARDRYMQNQPSDEACWKQ